MNTKTKTPKRLTPEQYETAKTMWASGRYTLSSISERFDISIQALQKRFARDGISKGMNVKKHAEAVEKAMENSIVNEAQAIAKLIKEEKEVSLKFSEQIRKRTMYEIAKATQEKIPLAAIEPNLKALAVAQKIMNGCYDLSSRVLGIERFESKDDEIAVLRIEEMTQEDIKEMREVQQKQMAELIEGDIDEMFDDEVVIVSGEDDAHDGQ